MDRYYYEIIMSTEKVFIDKQGNETDRKDMQDQEIIARADTQEDAEYVKEIVEDTFENFENCN